MSRQFRFYLLPPDIEDLTTELSRQIGMKILKSTSPTPEPVEISSALNSLTRTTKDGKPVSSVYCLLAPPMADIKMSYYPTRCEWLIDEQKSEVIQFCDCDFDRKLLLIGRFYAATDMLIGDTIWPKDKEFLRWVDRVFRAAKKRMTYSKDSEAYLDKEAAQWRKQGGQFISFPTLFYKQNQEAE